MDWTQFKAASKALEAALEKRIESAARCAADLDPSREGEGSEWVAEAEASAVRWRAALRLAHLALDGADGWTIEETAKAVSAMAGAETFPPAAEAARAMVAVIRGE